MEPFLHSDAWHLYVHITDFLVRFEMYSDAEIEAFEDLLRQSGLDRAAEAAVGQFIAQLKHFRANDIPCL